MSDAPAEMATPEPAEPLLTPAVPHPLASEMVASGEVLMPDATVTVELPDGRTVVARVETAAPLPVNKLTWPKFLGLVIFPVTLVTILWGGPSGFFEELRDGINPAKVEVASAPVSGARLFTQHCAYCHGERGDGKGVASLTTPARYFGAEPFKFTHTDGTKVPTDDELVATLKRGIAGSSMPSFEALGEEQLRSLVAQVRARARRGKLEALTAKAIKDADDGGDEYDAAKVAKRAEDALAVGTPIGTPAGFPAATAESLAAGKRVFQNGCASCHGPEGLGNGPQVASLRNDNQTPAVPRNLTTGVFKGGAAKADLYARIRLGIPGTPMPASPALSDAEVGDLINYVLSLSGGERLAAK